MFIKIVPIELNREEAPCSFSVFQYEAKNYSIHKQVMYPHEPKKEVHNKHYARSGTRLENDYFGQRPKFEMYEIFTIGMDTKDGYKTLHAPFSNIFILNNDGKTIDTYYGCAALRS